MKARRQKHPELSSLVTYTLSALPYQLEIFYAFETVKWSDVSLKRMQIRQLKKSMTKKCIMSQLLDTEQLSATAMHQL